MHVNQMSRIAARRRGMFVAGRAFTTGPLMILAWGVRPRRYVVAVCAGFLACAFVNVARGQTGTRTIMRGNDDGTHEIVHLTSPDLEGIRKPDFTLSDVPIFTDSLVLSAEQTAFITSLIKKHLTDFAAKVDEFTASVPMLRVQAQQNAESDPARALLSMKDLADELPKGINVSTGITTFRGTSADGDAQAAPPTVKVNINLDVPEGEDLSEDVTRTIRDRVNRAATLMQERMIAEQDEAAAAGRIIPSATNDDALEQLLEEQDALLAAVDALMKSKAKLRGEFVAEAHTILAEEQAARWPALERALYRDRSLPKGQFPGESIDLLKVISEQQLSQEALGALAALAETYDVTLDGALRQRDAFLVDAPRKIDQAIAERQPDKALILSDRLTALRVAVRAVNHLFTTAFIEALGDEAGGAFRQTVQARCYPKVYRELRGQKLFAAIADSQAPPGVGELDSQTRAMLADVQEAYEIEIAAMSESIRKLIDEEQPKTPRRQLEYMKDALEGRHAEFDEDLVEARFAQRAAIDERYANLSCKPLAQSALRRFPSDRLRAEGLSSAAARKTCRADVAPALYRFAVA